MGKRRTNAVLPDAVRPMTEYCSAHPLDRSGLAALSDLDKPEWRELFSVLQAAEGRFLERENEFRSPDYRWPRRTLNSWSRCWEYPYAYHHLRQFRREWTGADLPQLVDVGSGVTFFPFAASKLGYDVLCLDVDPVCQRDLERAMPITEHLPGRMRALTGDGRCIPLNDDAADCAVCISVLEHIPDYVSVVQEIARIVRPGGALILTIDLDLRGDHEMGVAAYQRLLAELRLSFDYLLPSVSIHPGDMLRSSNGPHPLNVPMEGLRRAWFEAKQHVIKPLLGRRPCELLPFDLAVAGFVLRRRAGCGRG